jgi:hypothetical protein
VRNVLAEAALLVHQMLAVRTMHSLALVRRVQTNATLGVDSWQTGADHPAAAE